uniref:Integrase catalytic domain-containing protein n=1 Tax=Strigamia maritima TaxID=126957 RepID=T1IL81_STRMM
MVVWNGKLQEFYQRVEIKKRRSAQAPLEKLKPLRLKLGKRTSSITGRGTVELSVVVNGAVSVIELQNVYHYVKGVGIQRINAYSPEMNVVAEHVSRTILNGVRATLLSAGLPKRLWAKLAMTII